MKRIVQFLHNLICLSTKHTVASIVREVPIIIIKN